MERQINKIYWDTEEAIRRWERAGYENDIARETIDAKVKILKEQAIGAWLANQQASENIALTKEQNIKIRTEVASILYDMDAKFYQMSQKDKEIAIQQQLADYNTSMSKEGLNGLVSLILKLIPVK